MCWFQNSETAEKEQERVAPKISKDESSTKTETDSQEVAPAQGATGKAGE